MIVCVLCSSLWLLVFLENFYGRFSYFCIDIWHDFVDGKGEGSCLSSTYTAQNDTDTHTPVPRVGFEFMSSVNSRPVYSVQAIKSFYKLIFICLRILRKYGRQWMCQAAGHCVFLGFVSIRVGCFVTTNKYWYECVWCWRRHSCLVIGGLLLSGFYYSSQFMRTLLLSIHLSKKAWTSVTERREFSCNVT